MRGLGSDVEEDSLDVSSRQDVTMETETSAVEPVTNLTENMRQGAAMETEAPAVEPVSDLTENMNTNATEPAEDRVRMPENIDVSTENAIVSPLVEDVISENVRNEDEMLERDVALVQQETLAIVNRELSGARTALAGYAAEIVMLESSGERNRGREQYLLDALFRRLDELVRLDETDSRTYQRDRSAAMSSMAALMCELRV